MRLPARTESDLSSATPLDSFSRCHQGIIARLEEAVELPQLAEAATRARAVASRLQKMFDEMVIKHHQEEEVELFPAVLRCASAQEYPLVKRLVAQLVIEHRAVESEWKQLQQQVRRLARGSDTALDGARMMRLVQLYLQHARTEEAEFLPLADGILRRNGDHLAALAVALHMRHMRPLAGHI